MNWDMQLSVDSWIENANSVILVSFLARTLARSVRPAFTVARRGYAEAVPADKLRLSFALPYETPYVNADV